MQVLLVTMLDVQGPLPQDHSPLVGFPLGPLQVQHEEWRDQLEGSLQCAGMLVQNCKFHMRMM